MAGLTRERQIENEAHGEDPRATRASSVLCFLSKMYDHMLDKGERKISIESRTNTRLSSHHLHEHVEQYAQPCLITQELDCAAVGYKIVRGNSVKINAAPQRQTPFYPSCNRGTQH